MMMRVYDELITVATMSVDEEGHEQELQGRKKDVGTRGEWSEFLALEYGRAL